MLSPISPSSSPRRGFTLIELLVVVSILGILSTIGLANFRTSQIKAKDAQRKSDLKQIQTAVELIYNDYGKYPLSNATGQILACNYIPAGASTPCTWGDTTNSMSDSKTTYLKTIPKDPSGQNYFYESDGIKYRILARLENTQDPSLVIGLTKLCFGALVCNFGLSSANTNVYY